MAVLDLQSMQTAEAAPGVRPDLSTLSVQNCR